MNLLTFLRYRLLIWILISANTIVMAISATAFAQDPTLPGGVASVLRESKLEHDQAMINRFEPIIRDLSRGVDVQYAQLYSDAVRTVFFSQDTQNGSGWSEWQKENKGVLEDPRLPLATEASAYYLQGHLNLILGRQAEASICFNKVLNILATGPKDLAGFQIMQESLATTLLFKYYGIAPEYLDTKGTYCGSIAEAELFFKALILPDAISSDPQNIQTYWNTAITAIGNTSSITDTQRQKYAVDDYPRLVLEESQCLVQLGQKKAAVYQLEQLLSSYPDSPRYKEISDALINASSSTPIAK